MAVDVRLDGVSLLETVLQRRFDGIYGRRKTSSSVGERTGGKSSAACTTTISLVTATSSFRVIEKLEDTYLAAALTALLSLPHTEL